MLGKSVAASLMLKAQRIDGRTGLGELPRGIEYHQIKDALAGASRNSGAADMLSVGPWRGAGDQKRSVALIEVGQ